MLYITLNMLPAFLFLQLTHLTSFLCPSHADLPAVILFQALCLIFPIPFSLFCLPRFFRNILKETLPNSFIVDGSAPFLYTHCACIVTVHMVVCVLPLVDFCFLSIGIMSYCLICLSQYLAQCHTVGIFFLPIIN